MVVFVGIFFTVQMKTSFTFNLSTSGIRLISDVTKKIHDKTVGVCLAHNYSEHKLITFFFLPPSYTHFYTDFTIV